MSMNKHNATLIVSYWKNAWKYHSQVLIFSVNILSKDRKLVIVLEHQHLRKPQDNINIVCLKLISNVFTVLVEH